MDALSAALPPTPFYVVFVACVAAVGTVASNLTAGIGDPHRVLRGGLEARIVYGLGALALLAAVHLLALLIAAFDGLTGLQRAHAILHGVVVGGVVLAYWRWGLAQAHFRSQL